MGADAKMLGRKGWHGQCSCCNDARGKRAERAIEEQEWREAEEVRCDHDPRNR